MIQRRAWLSGTVALLVLVVLAIPLFSMRLAFTDASNDPTSLTTRQAFDLLSEGFGPGFNGPLVVAAPLSSPARSAPWTGVDSALRATPGSPRAPVEVNADRNGGCHRRLSDHRSRGRARPLSSSPDSGRPVIPGATAGTGLKVLVGGETAAGVDAATYLVGRLPWVIGGRDRACVPAADGGVPFGGHPGQGGNHEPPVGRRRLRRDRGRLPVGLGRVHRRHRAHRPDRSVDTSHDVHHPLRALDGLRGVPPRRIREEWRQTGDNSVAVADGLTKTARVITAAAAIMICVFGSFVIGDPLRVLKVFGLGLAVSILIDATLVRLVLVPSVMELLGPANWYMPGWLDRIVPTLGAEVDADPPEHPVDHPIGALRGDGSPLVSHR